MSSFDAFRRHGARQLTVFALLLVTALVAAETASPAAFYAPGAEAHNRFVARYQQDKIERLSSHIEERFRVTGDRARTIVSAAVQRGLENQLQPELILAVIAVESSFRPQAVSSVGARGLMQVMAEYHPNKVARIGGAQGLFDPRKNISTGAQILLGYLEASDGDLRQALLRYNGSLSNPKSPYADKVLRAYREFRQVGEPAPASDIG